MTRDEALQLQISDKPCFYSGDSLKSWKGKPLYIRQLTYPQVESDKARVSTTVWGSINQSGETNGDITSKWVSLEELSVEVV